MSVPSAQPSVKVPFLLTSIKENPKTSFAAVVGTVAALVFAGLAIASGQGLNLGDLSSFSCNDLGTLAGGLAGLSVATVVFNRVLNGINKKEQDQPASPSKGQPSQVPPPAPAAEAPAPQQLPVVPQEPPVVPSPAAAAAPAPAAAAAEEEVPQQPPVVPSPLETSLMRAETAGRASVEECQKNEFLQMQREKARSRDLAQRAELSREARADRARLQSLIAAAASSAAPAAAAAPASGPQQLPPVLEAGDGSTDILLEYVF